MESATNGVATIPAKQSEFSWVSPTLLISGGSKSLSFYEKAFGFSNDIEIKNSQGEFMWAKMGYQGCSLCFYDKAAVGDNCPTNLAGPSVTGVPSPVCFYIYVEDIRAAFKRAVAAGCIVISNPTNQFWGDCTAELQCPEGYIWTIARQVGDYDPTKAPAQWQ